MAQFLVAHPIPAARIPVVGHSMDLNAEIQRLRRDSAAQRLVISQLRMRVEELEEDCEDLQGICAANGVDHREPLAAVRHRRQFARRLQLHPLGEVVTASEALGVAAIAHIVAKMTGSIPHRRNSLLELARVSRSMFSVVEELAVEFSWQFSFGRCVSSITDSVQCLVGRASAYGFNRNAIS